MKELKRILSAIIALALCIGMLALPMSAENGDEIIEGSGGVTVTQQANGRITATWSAVADAATYTYEVLLEGRTILSNTLNHTDSVYDYSFSWGTVISGTYVVNVIARDAENKILATKTGSVDVTVTTTNGIFVCTRSASTVTVDWSSWSAPADVTITGYNITYTVSGKAAVINSIGNVTSFVIANVTPTESVTLTVQYCTEASDPAGTVGAITVNATAGSTTGTTSSIYVQSGTRTVCWSTVTNAASYNIYANGTLVGSTASTYYNAPEGITTVAVLAVIEGVERAVGTVTLPATGNYVGTGTGTSSGSSSGSGNTNNFTAGGLTVSKGETSTTVSWEATGNYLVTYQGYNDTSAKTVVVTGNSVEVPFGYYDTFNVRVMLISDNTVIGNVTVYPTGSRIISGSNCTIIAMSDSSDVNWAASVAPPYIVLYAVDGQTKSTTATTNKITLPVGYSTGYTLLITDSTGSTAIASAAVDKVGGTTDTDDAVTKIEGLELEFTNSSCRVSWDEVSGANHYYVLYGIYGSTVGQEILVVNNYVNLPFNSSSSFNVYVYAVDSDGKLTTIGTATYIAGSTPNDTPTVVPGDINGDGKLNITDVLRLAKYVAGWDVEIDINAVDTTGDGKVNITDVLRLAKAVAGWDVEIYYNDTTPSTDLTYSLANGNTSYTVTGIDGTYVENTDNNESSSISCIEFTIPVYPKYGYATDNTEITFTLPAIGEYYIDANGAPCYLGTADSSGEFAEYPIQFGTLSHSWDGTSTVIPQSAIVGDSPALKLVAVFPEGESITAADFVSGGEYVSYVNAASEDYSASGCEYWNPIDSEIIVKSENIIAHYSSVEFTLPIYTPYGYVTSGMTLTLNLPYFAFDADQSGMIEWDEGTNYYALINGEKYALGQSTIGTYGDAVYGEIVPYVVNFGVLTHGWDGTSTVLPQSTLVGEMATITLVAEYPVLHVNGDFTAEETFRVSAESFMSDADGDYIDFVEGTATEVTAVVSEYDTLSTTSCYNWQPVNREDLKWCISNNSKLIVEDTSVVIPEYYGINASIPSTTHVEFEIPAYHEYGYATGDVSVNFTLPYFEKDTNGDGVIEESERTSYAILSNGVEYRLGTYDTPSDGDLANYSVSYGTLPHSWDGVSTVIPQSAFVGDNNFMKLVADYPTMNTSEGLFMVTSKSFSNLAVDYDNAYPTLIDYAWAATSQIKAEAVSSGYGTVGVSYCVDWNISDDKTSVIPLRYSESTVPLDKAYILERSAVEFTVPVWPEYGYATNLETLTFTLPSKEIDGKETYAYAIISQGYTFLLGTNEAADANGNKKYEVQIGTLAHGWDGTSTVIPRSALVGDSPALKLVGNFLLDKEVNANDFMSGGKFASDVKVTDENGSSFCYNWNPTDSSIRLVTYYERGNVFPQGDIVQFTVPVWHEYGYAQQYLDLTFHLPADGTYDIIYNGELYSLGTLGTNTDRSTTNEYKVTFGSLPHSWDGISTVLPEGPASSIKLIGCFPITYTDDGTAIRTTAETFLSEGSVHVYAEASGDFENSTSYCFDWNPVNVDYPYTHSWYASLSNSIAYSWDASLANKADLSSADTVKIRFNFSGLLVGNYHFGLKATYEDGSVYDSGVSAVDGTTGYAAYVEVDEPATYVEFEVPADVMYNSQYGVYNKTLELVPITFVHESALNVINQLRENHETGTLGNYSWDADNIYYYGGLNVSEYPAWEDMSIVSASVEGYEAYRSPVLPVTEIYSDAFYCSNIKSVVIPETITTVGSRAFMDCTDLKTVTLWPSMGYICLDAFDGCDNLTTVYFYGTKDQWDYLAANCVDSGNEPLLNANIIFLTVPDVEIPANVVITEAVGGQGTATIKWTAIPNATQYKVYFATANGYAYKLKATVTTNSATVVGLEAGDYKVRVKALINDEWTALADCEYVTVTVS